MGCSLMSLLVATHGSSYECLTCLLTTQADKLPYLPSLKSQKEQCTLKPTYLSY